jgi:hypothetical protein
LLAAAWLPFATTTLAQDRAATSGLAAAEKAYQEVDFAAMHDQATHALAAGGATRDETARLYVLLGISAAALGEDEEAKRGFVVALAVDPTLKLDRTLSPKIREPYLDAQGFWGAHAERLALQARAAADGEHLTVELVDPAHLATKIGLHVRALGAPAFQTYTADAGHTTRFPLPPDAHRRGFEYFASALDEHQNVLAELGNDGDPRLERAAVSATLPPAPARVTGPEAQQRRSYLLPIALGAAGLVATGVGVVFHLERESAAREWNSPRCEQPGTSRIAQCANVDSRRGLDEAMAIGAYTAAGLLFTGGVVALLVGRSASSERPSRPAAGAHLIGCGLTGLALSCTGRF